MIEAQLETLLRHQVLKHGGLSFKLAPTTAGMPDRMVLWPGGVIHLVELKTDTGPLRRVQEVWHGKALALGTTVQVVRGASGVHAYVEENGVLS